MDRLSALRHLAALAAGLALLAAFPAAGAPAEVSLRVNGKTVVVPGLAEEGRTYFSLDGAAAVLGGTVYDGQESVRLVTVDGEVTFPAGMPSLAAVNGKMISLPGATVTHDGGLFVPVEAFEVLFASLEPPSEKPEAPPGASPAEVRVAGGSEEIRIIVNSAVPMSPHLRGTAGDLMVTFGEGVFLAPPYAERTLNGSLLRRFAFVQEAKGTVLRLTPGPGFRIANIDNSAGPNQVAVVLSGNPVPTRRAFLGARGGEGISRVVIDPGHGGSEDGAIGPGGVKEKDVTLQVAFQLRELLERQGLQVHLTRTVDRDLGLDERAAIANNKQADLFISLHANASPRPKARGAETYFLAREATDDEARTTAALENDAARRGESVREHEGLDLVLWELAQVEYLGESAALAEIIQKELNETLGLADRGVRQAPFRVLMGATMPAVLVEIGFMSNPEEEKLLADVGYQDRVAGAVARAIASFREAYELRLGVGGPRGRSSR